LRKEQQKPSSPTNQIYVFFGVYKKVNSCVNKAIIQTHNQENLLWAWACVATAYAQEKQHGSTQRVMRLVC